ncbi:MAG: LamG-like jellyroll fold domain-containing protein [Verrucomicrobiota bacterium]
MDTRLPCRFILTAALLAAGHQGHSAVLLDENFTSTGGGFTETALVGAPVIPWTYNNVTGVWVSNGEATGPIEDELVSPEVTMPATAFVRVTFSHRYNFEEAWDGGAIQYAVDGGEWLDVEPASFVQNGYGLPIVGTGSLKNKSVFSGESAGFADPGFITSIVDLPKQTVGSKIKVRFLGAWDEGTAPAAPNWEITGITVESLADTDSDGMPDVYELAHSLNKDVNDATADPDNDLSSNITEFERRTNPQKADTDGDGYRDGVETLTTAWGSVTDTGTNPLDADTDGDGLLDGVENPTLAFTGLTQTGTDPNITDSDTDSWDDRTETVFGGNPKVTATTPSLPAASLHILASWNFNDSSKPAAAVDQSHGFRGKLTGRATFSSDAGGRTGTAGDRALNLGSVQSAGTTMQLPDASFLNFTGVNNQVSIAFWQKLDSVTASHAFFAKFIPGGGDTRGLSAHATWNNNNFYWDTAGCCAEPTQRQVVGKPAALNLTTAWHHIVFQKNGPLKEIWVDGVLLASQTGSSPLPTNFTSLFVGSGDNGGNNTAGLVDDFTVFAEALTEPQIKSLAAGSSPLTLLDDTDGDGMLDNYEEANGLNKNSAADRNTDFDSDESSNFQEYTRGTRANNPDTDGDTLKDGVETGTGSWSSSTSTGTNPLKTDTDGDGWADNVETNTGTYANAADTGTNPNKLDTDGDTISDSYEVKVLLTSPFNAAIPVLGAGTGIGISFTGDAGTPGITSAELAGFAFVSQKNWNISDGAATGATANIMGPAAGKLVNAAGVETAATVVWDSANIYNAGNGTATGNSKIMNGYLDTNATTGEHVDLAGIPYATYDLYVYFGSDGNGRTGSIANLSSGEEYFYVTASMRGAATGFHYHDFLVTGATAASVAESANYMVFQNQGTAAINLQVNRGSNNSGIHAIQIVPIPDTDGDGMSDAYEKANGLLENSNTDRDSDADGDGLSNLMEYRTHTRANMKDTDGDGFQDNVETKTGIWKSAGETGSHPLKADTDGDGLLDGVENKSLPSTGLTQAGSDPNLADSDNDLWSDFLEASYHSNPNVDTSIPVLDSSPLHLLAYWPYNDASDRTRAVDVAHSLTGTIGGGTVYTADAGGRTGLAGDRAMDFTLPSAAGKAMQVRDGMFINIAAEQDAFSISFWQKLRGTTASTVFRGVSTSASGANRGMSAHATWNDSNFYFDTAGCCAQPGMRNSIAKPAALDLTQWHHFVFQKNGPVKEFWVDGVNLITGDGADVLPVDFTEFTVGGNSAGELINGLVDDFAFFAEALTESQIAQLAAGASPPSLILPALPPGPDITSVIFNNGTRTLSLTWVSSAGKQYKVERSSDLVTWMTVAPAHPSGGASTTYSDGSLPGTVTRYFYRVSEL